MYIMSSLRPSLKVTSKPVRNYKPPILAPQKTPVATQTTIQKKETTAQKESKSRV